MGDGCGLYFVLAPPRFMSIFPPQLPTLLTSGSRQTQKQQPNKDCLTSSHRGIRSDLYNESLIIHQS